MRSIGNCFSSTVYEHSRFGEPRLGRKACALRRIERIRVSRRVHPAPAATQLLRSIRAFSSRPAAARFAENAPVAPPCRTVEITFVKPTGPLEEAKIDNNTNS
jgi:hypothetical protein